MIFNIFKKKIQMKFLIKLKNIKWKIKVHKFNKIMKIKPLKKILDKIQIIIQKIKLF